MTNMQASVANAAPLARFQRQNRRRSQRCGVRLCTCLGHNGIGHNYIGHNYIGAVEEDVEYVYRP